MSAVGQNVALGGGTSGCRPVSYGVEERRLARATWSHDGKHFASLDDAVGIVKDAQRLLRSSILDEHVEIAPCSVIL